VRALGSLCVLAVLGACARGLPPITGTQVVPDATTAALKTAAVNGAREEIARETGNGVLRQGVYLDTLVGPTPEAQLYEWAHPRPWLDAMVATHKVDGLFGIPVRREHLPRSAFALEVGEPFRAQGDTLQIIYDWCVRSFAGTRGTAGPAAVWRDLFVRGDTGWTRVGHLRAQAASACTP
jgi:hypothetical protein